MAVFTFHAPPGDLSAMQAAGRVVVVREGFSWGATLLPWVYLPLHRLWLGLVAYLLAIVGVSVLAWLLGAGASASMAATLLVSLLFGLEAPAFRQRALARRGLAHVGSVVADKREAAELKFFTAHTALGAAPRPAGPPVPPRPPSEPQALLFPSTASP